MSQLTRQVIGTQSQSDSNQLRRSQNISGPQNVNQLRRSQNISGSQNVNQLQRTSNIRRQSLRPPNTVAVQHYADLIGGINPNLFDRTQEAENSPPQSAQVSLMLISGFSFQ
ncbi:26152_t:CDS:1 [Dentiscutata erythropus]|uniref:26152_t:CDS:1 n=1 Tax=Dentiscutata erythropus TaxID=1348616 RepID=A0A9N9DNI6_9GLOM|nr:26152_t:CDS:1 [Dentiscutata erythropus]